MAGLGLVIAAGLALNLEFLWLRRPVERPVRTLH
jgi:hypothetical protein